MFPHWRIGFYLFVGTHGLTSDEIQYFSESLCHVCGEDPLTSLVTASVVADGELRITSNSIPDHATCFHCTRNDSCYSPAAWIREVLDVWTLPNSPLAVPSPAHVSPGAVLGIMTNGVPLLSACDIDLESLDGCLGRLQESDFRYHYVVAPVCLRGWARPSTTRSWLSPTTNLRTSSDVSLDGTKRQTIPMRVEKLQATDSYRCMALKIDNCRGPICTASCMWHMALYYDDDDYYYYAPTNPGAIRIIFGRTLTQGIRMTRVCLPTPFPTVSPTPTVRPTPIPTLSPTPAIVCSSTTVVSEQDLCGTNDHVGDSIYDYACWRRDTDCFSNARCVSASNGSDIYAAGVVFVANTVHAVPFVTFVLIFCWSCALRQNGNHAWPTAWWLHPSL